MQGVPSLHGLLRAPAAPSHGHEKPSVGLVSGHTRVEVPVHSAAGVRAADLAAGDGRRRPHAAHRLDLTLELLTGLASHAQLVQQFVHLNMAKVSLHYAA